MINIQKIRARLFAFRNIINLYPEYVGFLRNGTLPDNDAVKTDFEILENEYFGKTDADNKTPLTFTELSSYNTWFYLHPEKIAGTEHLTTSREFPVNIKGSKEDIINTIKAGIKSNPDKEKRIRIAKAKAAAKLKLLEIMNLGNIPTGDFGTIYTEFKDRPKEAIKHLKKVQEGECINALYHYDIGYIDIVWGENDENNKGYGLKHIIAKHSKEIKQFGFEVEDFIPIVVQFGNLKPAKEKEKMLLESQMFRVVLMQEWKGKKEKFILTAFDLRINKK